MRRRLVAVGITLASASLATVLVACGGDDTTPDCSSPDKMCGPVVTDGAADVTIDATGDGPGADTAPPADTGSPDVDAGPHDSASDVHDSASDAHDAGDAHDAHG